VVQQDKAQEKTMGLTSSGIGSGLDIEGIVTKLMAVEQRPLTALKTKEAGYQAKISALGTLKGALSALQTAVSALVPASGITPVQKFSIFNTTVADTAIASATATSSAVAGTYSLEVTQLAQQHRIATSTGVASPFGADNKLLGEGGTLTISLGTAGGSTPTKTTALVIDKGATPEAIRDAINSAKAGVSATVINGVNGKQLVLDGNSPGSDQSITLSGIDGLSYGVAGNTDEFTQLQPAQGSAFKLNGIAITASSNTVTTAIDGIALTLTKVSETNKPTSVAVTRDTSSLTAGVNAFVKAYNEFNATATSQGSYNTTTKVAGTLNGDSTLRTTQSIMRSLLGNVPSELSGATFQHLSDIGVSVQKNGSLAVDSTKLTAAISSDLPAVANLVSAFGRAFKTATEGLTSNSSSSAIASRTEGMQSAIKGLGKQSVAIVSRLNEIEKRYRKEFTNLDVMMAAMGKTSDYLKQQLANLPSIR
jgi:flagellar hook-associated protein 2